MSSVESPPMWAKVDGGAVDTMASTTRDNVDSTGCPPLPTFHQVKLGHRSSKVDSDAVDVVTALSTPPVDSASAFRWAPLSGFAPEQCTQNGPQLPRWHHVVDVVTTPAAVADAVTWAQKQDSEDLLLPPRTKAAGQASITCTYLCGRGPPLTTSTASRDHLRPPLATYIPSCSDSSRAIGAYEKGHPMFRTLHRTRGASALGARHPGEQGPFGVRPDEDDDGEDDGGGLDDEDDQDH